MNEPRNAPVTRRQLERSLISLTIASLLGIKTTMPGSTATLRGRPVDLSGFPDAASTGVPTGMLLNPSGSIVIDVPGAVVEGLDIQGTVIINALNVTMRYCKATSGGHAVVLVKPGMTGAVIQNCEINNLGVGGQGIAGQGTFLNNNIHDCSDGIDVRGNDTVIQDNFIYDMRGTADSHFDGIQADGNFSNLTIRHNTVINDNSQTSALMLDNYWGPIDRVVIDNNLLIGGGYAIYLNEVANGQPGGGTVTNVSLTNNRVGGGRWGHLDLRRELGSSPLMSGNVDHFTGAPLPGQRAAASDPPSRR